eukprot:gene3718-6606_t
MERMEEDELTKQELDSFENEIEEPISVEEYSIDIQHMPITEKTNLDMKWNLQVKIWSFVLLILSIVSIPFIFISGRPIENPNTREKTGIHFFLGFSWEPLVMFLISFPTSIIGIIGSIMKKTIFVKIIFNKMNEFDDTSLNHEEERESEHSFESSYIDDLNKTTRESTIVSNSNNKTWQTQVKIWSIVLLIVGVLLVPLIFFSIEPVRDSKGKPSGAHFKFVFRVTIFITAVLAIITSIFGIIGGFRRNRILVILYMIGLILVMISQFIDMAISFVTSILTPEVPFWLAFMAALLTVLFGMVPCGACIFCGIKFLIVQRQEDLSAKAFEEEIEVGDYSQFDHSNQQQDEDDDVNPFE